jgi:hypothetical protein
MSYSFNLRAATKADAKARVAAELAKVVQGQPIHEADRAQAQAAADAFIDVLPDDPSQDVSVNMSGSVGWTGTYPQNHRLVSVGVHCYASLVMKNPG